MQIRRAWYVHRPLGETIDAIGGSYRLDREGRLSGETADEGEILYVIGYLQVDRSCCGVGGCGFAIVQGRLLGWKERRNFNGYPMSEIAPLTSPTEQARWAERLRAQEFVKQVSFR